MTKPPKPEREWRSMHMGRQGKPKIAHRTALGAWWHKRRHIRALKIGSNRLDIYPCWFTDDNEFGRKHWHVGHRKMPSWLVGPTRDTPTKRARLKAIAEGGYRISVVLTEPELTRLEELAGNEIPVAEFASRAILSIARTATRCCHLDPTSCMFEVSRNERRQT